jgi:hypothetical protein
MDTLAETSPSTDIHQTPECVDFSSLPSEILFLIFGHIRPVYERPPTTSTRHLGRLFASGLITTFNRDLRDFADLRLLCTKWDAVISQIAYREVVIFVSKTTNMEKVAAMFERAADYIRSVVMGGEKSRSYTSERLQQRKTAEEIIVRGLRLCPNIQNLECYDAHYTFTSRKWLDTKVPTLASTVTSLVMCPGRSDFDLSDALVGLGRSIHTLEIQRWADHTDDSTFHLPAEMPNLSSLTLKAGCPPMDRVEKLFSRIRRKGAIKNVQVPLRSLTLFEVRSFSGHNILTLLSINNIGAQLTSLRLQFDIIRDITFVTVALQACPRLLSFAYTSLVGKHIFEHLPLTLEHLEFALVKGHSTRWTSRLERVLPISLDDSRGYVGSGRAQSLRTLSILIRDVLVAPSQDDISRLNSLCTGRGIALHIGKRLPTM